MVTAEQIKALGERLERLQSYLNLEQKRIHIINEEEKTASPEFWDDPKKAEVTLKALRGVKFWVEGALRHLAFLRVRKRRTCPN